MAGEIFISYRRSDEPRARLLYTRLKELGVEPWYDAHVAAGADWRKATAAALEASRIVVLLYSKAASESEDIAKELAAATFAKKQIIPVRIENVPPTGPFLYELASRNWIDAFERTDAKLAELAPKLAAMVKSGGAAPVGLGAGHDHVSRRRTGVLIAAAAAGVLAAAALAYLFAPRTSATVAGRIAFFGIDASADDKEAAAAASATTNSIVTTFTTLQRDVVSSADTQGVPAQQRGDRAVKLRAVYAIGGAVTRLGDTLSVAFNVEDAPSHTVLMSDAVSGKASNPTSLAARVAAQLNDRLTCIITSRAGFQTDDTRILARLNAACASVRFSEPGNEQRWAELVALAPNSAWALASEATAIVDALLTAAPTAVEDMKRRATEAEHKAEQIDPNLMEVQIARVDIAEMNGASLAEIEALWLEGLRRAPNTANVNGIYGLFLHGNGRLSDGMPYARRTLALDPLSQHKMLGNATILTQLRQPVEAEQLYQQRHALFPDVEEWHRHFVAALFNGVGDVDAVLADPPPDAKPQAITCLTDIARLVRQKTLAAKKEALQRAAACDAAGSVQPFAARLVAAFLGDFDPMFSPTADFNRDRYFMMDPALSALHADPRFLPLMKAHGLVDYWRATRPPDFCKTEKAPVCAAIAAK